MQVVEGFLHSELIKTLSSLEVWEKQERLSNYGCGLIYRKNIAKFKKLKNETKGENIS